MSWRLCVGGLMSCVVICPGGLCHKGFSCEVISEGLCP